MSLILNNFHRFELLLLVKIKIINLIPNGVNILKKYTGFIITGALIMGILTGCGSKEELSLDPKHKELPDYVLNASEKVQETYVMAAQYPEVLASVPCYCGCYAEDGHKSNLDCFVDNLGSDMQVTEWDSMGIS